MGKERGREGAQGPEPSEGRRFVLHKEMDEKINPQGPNKWDKEDGAGRGGRVRVWGTGTVLRAGWQCLSPEEAQLAWGCSRWLFLQTS